MSALSHELSFREEELPRGRDAVRALLLDDDGVDVSLIRRLSRNARQIDMFLRTCGSIDLARLALEEARFDILFIDYWLGQETSISFILEVATTQHIPCVLITGLDTPEIRRCAFRAGVVGFLSKDELSIQAIESVTLTVLRHSGKLC